jgi:uncharacterized protein (DUF697 family)
MEEGHLIKAAGELTQAMNRVADENLPGKLAGLVKLHAGIAVGSALIPIPGADIAAASVNIWTMYVRINKELGLPFSENALKSLAAGMATNLAGNAVGMIAGSLLKFIPGVGSVGGAVIMGGTVYAITITAGIVYMRAVAKLLNSKSADRISADDLREAAETVSRSSDIQDIMKAAKKNYKAERTG